MGKVGRKWNLENKAKKKTYFIKRLAIFTSFNLRCRYSKDKMAFYKIADEKFTKPYYKDAKKLIQWLKKK